MDERRAFSDRLCRTQLGRGMTSPARVEKRTSAAKAVKRAANYGTAEPVPFVRQSLPQPLRCCPDWPTETSNLDRCESSAVPVRQAPTASRGRQGRLCGTEFGSGGLTHALKPIPFRVFL